MEIINLTTIELEENSYFFGVGKLPIEVKQQK